MHWVVLYSTGCRNTNRIDKPMNSAMKCLIKGPLGCTLIIPKISRVLLVGEKFLKRKVCFYLMRGRKTQTDSRVAAAIRVWYHTRWHLPSLLWGVNLQECFMFPYHVVPYVSSSVSPTVGFLFPTARRKNKVLTFFFIFRRHVHSSILSMINAPPKTTFVRSSMALFSLAYLFDFFTPQMSRKQPVNGRWTQDKQTYTSLGLRWIQILWNQCSWDCALNTDVRLPWNDQWPWHTFKREAHVSQRS